MRENSGERYSIDCLLAGSKIGQMDGEQNDI